MESVQNESGSVNKAMTGPSRELPAPEIVKRASELQQNFASIKQRLELGWTQIDKMLRAQPLTREDHANMSAYLEDFRTCAHVYLESLRQDLAVNLEALRPQESPGNGTAATQKAKPKTPKVQDAEESIEH